jgi:rhomboid protease GluP
MFSMYLVGSLLEKKAGRPFVIAMYFITGIGAGIFSVWYHDLVGDMFYAHGASGIVFGLEGALMSYMLMSKSMRSKMVFLVAIGCYALTFMEPAEHIDTAGHVGGLVCGLIAGGIWCIVSSSRKRKKVSADEGSVE